MSDFASVIQRKLEKLMKESSGPVNIGQLFPSPFMRMHTNGKFPNAKAFFKNSELQVKCQKDLDDLPDEKLNSFVVEHTDFESWEEMFRKGAGKIAEDRMRGNSHAVITDHADPFDNIIFDLNLHVR